MKHAGYGLDCSVDIKWIESADLEDDPSEVKQLEDVHGVLVPGGFGKRGSEGKILAIKYARENEVPYLGICFGFQLAAVEFARNVLNLEGANSVELNPRSPHPVIDILPEQKNIKQMGGNMRLGEIKADVNGGTRAMEIYGAREIGERHRHRFEVNPSYIKEFEKNGMVFSARSDESRRMEILEFPGHPHFLATQFHPEFKSRPQRPSPPFLSFVKAAIKHANELQD